MQAKSGPWVSCRPAWSIGMHELALGHCEMVPLVMRPAHHEADEAEAADMLHLLRVAGCDGQQNAVRQRLGLGAPAIKMALFNLLSMPGIMRCMASTVRPFR